MFLSKFFGENHTCLQITFFAEIPQNLRAKTKQLIKLCQKKEN